MSVQKSVIIITYGRTGSTLLVGLLNSAPKTLIRGENGNVFFHLFKAYEVLTKVKKRGGAKPNNPFYGINKADIGGFLDLCRESVYKILAVRSGWMAGPTTIGFKEIRYLNMSGGEMSDYIDFMQLIFPRPVFVFLTRDHEQVMSSGFHQNNANKDKLKSQLKACDENFRTIAAARNDAFSIDYSDLKADSPRLRALFAFAGLGFDEDRVKDVLQVDHSPQTPARLKKQRWSADTVE